MFDPETGELISYDEFMDSINGRIQRLTRNDEEISRKLSVFELKLDQVMLVVQNIDNRLSLREKAAPGRRGNGKA